VSQRPFIIGVGGFTSEVGKTRLVCDLLRAFPGWEAIKTTRGHYRSCGKDPHACCVSDLLGAEPLIRSGHEQTYEAGKDTGRYWDAGASNVHWVIVTDEQVEQGISNALSRVQTPGVFVEGNSFTKFVEPDFFVMVVRADEFKLKSTAREALNKVSAYYISEALADRDRDFVAAQLREKISSNSGRNAPIFSTDQLGDLVALIQHSSRSIAA
jgi:hypothetical protein